MRLPLLISVLLFFLLTGPALAAGSLGSAEFYSDLAWTLDHFIDSHHLVDYAGLKKQPNRLRRFLSQLAKVSPDALSELASEHQIAFWINAYNAFTLQAIIDNYPIKAGFFSSFVYPSNSIRQIDGVWDELKFRVSGRELTLDEMEHSILRKNFAEPRIHMALVCAALSCPPLRTEPFYGDQLDGQLRDQTRRFLNHPQKFKIDKGSGVVSLSTIFDWFGGDFEQGYQTSTHFEGRSAALRAVLNFILENLEDADARAYLQANQFRVTFLEYDWTLNGQ